MAILDRLDDTGEASCCHDHQAHGHLCDRVMVHARGVANPYAVSVCGFNINRIVAHAAAGNDFQPGNASEHVSGDRFAGQNGTGGAVEERLPLGSCPRSAGGRVDGTEAMLSEEPVKRYLRGAGDPISCFFRF